MKPRNEDLEILSDLMDAVPVDPDRLADVLERPEARAALVDFARFRHHLAPERAPAGTPQRAPSPRTVAPRWRGWAAAALVAAALLAGYGAGRRGATPPVERPPKPDRVLTFDAATEWRAAR